jgi:hypothetical protein
MISLVDDAYYQRAWCALEVIPMRAIVVSYGLHQWWEHSDGYLENFLKKGDTEIVFNISSLKLTKEKLDISRVDFLMMQSKLLGKDNA